MVMALTYYGIINLLFLGMIIFSGKIRKANQPWFDSEGFDTKTLYIFIILGFIILLMCTSGIFLMLKKRRGGFYLFLAGAILLLVSDFFLVEFDWMRYLINSGFIFLLGILHFTGKCYSKKDPEKATGTPKDK